MANLGTIRSQVLDRVASSSMITSADVTNIIAAEHTTLLEDYSWTRRKGDTTVATVAPYSTGTVTTSGATVTGTGTTFTAAMVGRWIRVDSNTFFSKITAFGSATSLTLEAALPSDVSSASAYTIFQHVYDLPTDFGRATSVTGDVRLSEWPRPDIDRIDPYRSATTSKPDVYSIRGLDPPPTGPYMIEFWPVPSSAFQFRVEYLKTNTLVADADAPLYRSDVLVWKSAESACFFLYSRTGDRSWLDLADRYHARYLEALEGARLDDLGKYSPVTYIKQRTGYLGTRGDNYWIQRDDFWLNYY